MSISGSLGAPTNIPIISPSELKNGAPEDPGPPAVYLP